MARFQNKTVGRPNLKKVKRRQRQPEASMYGTDWDILSDFVKKRDDYTCMAHKIGMPRCGLRFPPPFSNLLHAHHIVPLPRGVNHPTNLITLCKDCHGRHHGKNLGTISDKQKMAARNRSTTR